VAELLAMAYTNIIRKRDPPSVGASGSASQDLFASSYHVSPQLRYTQFFLSLPARFLGLLYFYMVAPIDQQPRYTHSSPGIIPLPMWMAVSGIFAYDTYRTATDKVCQRTVVCA
jgi:hypothetical protein